MAVIDSLKTNMLTGLNNLTAAVQEEADRRHFYLVQMLLEAADIIHVRCLVCFVTDYQYPWVFYQGEEYSIRIIGSSWFIENMLTVSHRWKNCVGLLVPAPSLAYFEIVEEDQSSLLQAPVATHPSYAA